MKRARRGTCWSIPKRSRRSRLEAQTRSQRREAPYTPSLQTCSPRRPTRVCRSNERGHSSRRLSRSRSRGRKDQDTSVRWQPRSSFTFRDENALNTFPLCPQPKPRRVVLPPRTLGTHTPPGRTRPSDGGEKGTRHKTVLAVVSGAARAGWVTATRLRTKGDTGRWRTRGTSYA